MLAPQGRVVMVSGASRGIGQAIAERLLAVGCVVSAGVRQPGRMPPQVGLGVHRYDAAEPATADAWVAATVAAHGRVDAVVNAAGVNSRGTLLGGEDAGFGECWSVNAMAPLLLVRAAWPQLVAGGSGRVVTIGSLSGKRVRNDNLAYAMSKFAVMALNQEIRRLGWEHGIRATAFCPGFVATDMTARVTKLDRNLMSRPADAATLVETVLHLPNTATVAELIMNCRHEDTM